MNGQLLTLPKKTRPATRVRMKGTRPYVLLSPTGGATTVRILARFYTRLGRLILLREPTPRKPAPRKGFRRVSA